MNEDKETKATDREAIELLVSDPNSFFDSPRRVPFGFVRSTQRSDAKPATD